MIAFNPRPSAPTWTAEVAAGLADVELGPDHPAVLLDMKDLQ
ncbi:hypothetical protein ACWEPN_43865 [Nonomuraea wenchangensis]